MVRSVPAVLVSLSCPYRLLVTSVSHPRGVASLPERRGGNGDAERRRLRGAIGDVLRMLALMLMSLVSLVIFAVASLSP
jgi:hypothetical protein